MANRDEKLRQLHSYDPFVDSRDTYLDKNHYENYSTKMVSTNPTGWWTEWESNEFTSGYKFIREVKIRMKLTRNSKPEFI